MNIKAKQVTKKHFEEALKRIGPSITKELEKKYKAFQENLRKIKFSTKEEKPGYFG